MSLTPFQALTAWFYPGQPEIHAMLSCSGVADFMKAEKAQHAGETSHGNKVKTGKKDVPVVGEEDSDESATVSQKLEALVALYDVLLTGDLDRVKVETLGDENESANDEAAEEEE